MFHLYSIFRNAFTTTEYTSYEVYASSNFKENLEHLLDFVYTPYFTEANVKKEKGIIILDPMSGNLRKIIQDYISGLLNVSSFIIGKGKDKRIVLRYIDRNLNSQHINLYFYFLKS